MAGESVNYLFRSDRFSSLLFARPYEALIQHVPNFVNFRGQIS